MSWALDETDGNSSDLFYVYRTKQLDAARDIQDGDQKPEVLISRILDERHVYCI
jgi:hypothetical protein